ncbi:MAG: metallophosphoesterase [Ginsengibacter sp.]
MERLIIVFLSLFTLTNMIRSSDGHEPGKLLRDPGVQTDGPYVQYNNDEVLINYIIETNGAKQVRTSSTALIDKKNISLQVVTDLPGKIFQVSLKKKLLIEKSKFPPVKKLIALSDIEGQFGAFRKLLQANKVIDENFNWNFGNGHLVLDGDFFDRGQQVTEVLWLIYSLEQKAHDAGGYVHFILGNHEIMNLSGDLRYTPQKYLDNAKLMELEYMSLFDQNTELGRWLRTKNVAEKIGDLLFVHGGISPGLNNMNIVVDEINSIARPYYSDDVANEADQRAAIMFGDFGPMWYRGYYYQNTRDLSMQIDSTLQQFRVDHIITGHTITGDTISAWHGGKLLNLDVLHAEGKSEALLFENDKFYRVNANGQKTLLLHGDTKKR